MLVLAFAVAAWEATREPFPVGCSMANAGTILQQQGISGREAFTPASCYADSFRYAISLAGIDYFDPMDNMESSHMVLAAMGGLYNLRKFTLKGYASHFDALGVYFEQEGQLSAGTTIIPFVNPSVEVCGYRAGLYQGTDPAQTRADCGISAMVPFRFAARPEATELVLRCT